MKTNTTVKVPMKYQGMLIEIDFEGRDSGYWAYSKKGFQFAVTGCHTLNEDTQKNLLDMIRTLEPCECSECEELEGEFIKFSEEPVEEKNNTTATEEEEDDQVPEELHLCNECDEMYHEEMETGECCDGTTFRVVSKGDMGFN